jgi:hypothetical protein
MSGLSPPGVHFMTISFYRAREIVTCDSNLIFPYGIKKAEILFVSAF